MRGKHAYVVINPRAGQDMTKLPDVIAVLAAAGWKTDNALVEYSGHGITLATRAAEEGYDLIIAHGGDGTINEVVNGVMKSKGQQSIIGVLPGGTANQWATEIGMPLDPVKAALTLIESSTRTVDLGRIEVQGLTFPPSLQGDHECREHTKSKKAQKKENTASKAIHHFLLTAGLGIDASIIRDTSKLLKAHLGRVAFDVAAVKALPEQHPFPAELHAIENGHAARLLWRGEALQLVLGNTRRYAGVVEFTPNASIDDGALDVCVITAGNPLTTIEQVVSLFVRHKPDHTTAEYFRGAHLSLAVPASLSVQLDGSAVKLTDDLSMSDRDALHATADASQVMVTYLFDAVPHALQMAIPRAYDNTLFEKAPKEAKGQAPSSSSEEKEVLESSTLPANDQNNQQEHQDTRTETVQQESRKQVNAHGASGRPVNVVGVALLPEKKQTYVVAGSTHNQRTGKTKPAAVRIDAGTTVISRNGEHVSASTIQELQGGSVIVVEGKENKRGVIQATQVVL
jgi:YegS/Rv2252/BmrU family lipid kinase